MINLIQLTDLHLFANNTLKLANIDTQASFNRVVDLLNQRISTKKTGLLIFSGDLSQDDSIESYKYLKEKSAAISFPTGLMLGNHDHPVNFASTFSAPHQKHFIFDNWQIILLNSHWPDHFAGLLQATELEFLDSTLAKHSKLFTLIFIHHHILPINCPWLDKISLKNCDELLAVIDKYSNIKAVISGHVHQETKSIRNNIDFITTPSTCIQFAPNTEGFQLDTIMPGYRWFDLYPNGEMNTGVERISFDQKFVPPPGCKGY